MSLWAPRNHISEHTHTHTRLAPSSSLDSVMSQWQMGDVVGKEVHLAIGPHRLTPSATEPSQHASASSLPVRGRGLGNRVPTLSPTTERLAWEAGQGSPLWALTDLPSSFCHYLSVIWVTLSRSEKWKDLQGLLPVHPATGLPP